MADKTYTKQEAGALKRRLESTRGERLRQAMFPETMETEYHGPTTHLDDRPTNVHKLTQPCLLLKDALVGLVNFQSDALSAAAVVPELTGILQGNNDEDAEKAVEMVQMLSKNQASRHALLKDPDLVSALVKKLAETDSEGVRRSVAGTLDTLSQSKEGLLSIFKSNGVPVLVQMLDSANESVVNYALTTLHNLLLYQRGVKAAVRMAGGVQKMVGLLSREKPKFLAIDADCLHVMAYGDQQCKLIVLASNGPEHLVRIMRTHTYEKLLWTCSRLLKVLSVCASCKPVIVAAGGMQALGPHLGGQSERLTLNCLWILRNLSDAATQQDDVEDLIGILIRLLSSNVAEQVTCSAGILSNLTCNNERNKATVCRLNGVGSLVQTLMQAGEDHEDITEPAVSALKHLTSRHEGAEGARRDLVASFGLPMLVRLLDPEANFHVLKAVVGLMKNLSFGEGNSPLLRDHGAVPLLVEILTNSYYDHLQQAADRQEDARHEEMIEETTGVLHIMARDGESRNVMTGLNAIPFFAQLLASANEKVQRAAAGVLCELAQDGDKAVLIEGEQVADLLISLVDSENEAVATYAAACLYRISGDQKPAGYRDDYYYDGEASVLEMPTNYCDAAATDGKSTFSKPVPTKRTVFASPGQQKGKSDYAQVDKQYSGNAYDTYGL